LEPALELDSALLELSDTLAKKSLPEALESEVDLDRIIHFFEHQTLAQLKLWEYYVIDVDRVAAKFSQAWSSSEHPKSEGHSHIEWSEFEKACTNHEGCGWKQVTGPRGHISDKIDINSTVRLFQEKGYGCVSPEETMETLKRILNELNVERYQEYDDDVKAIIQNTRSRIRYTRLDPHGPKMGPITKK
jgi:glycogen debranching enzyme